MGSASRINLELFFRKSVLPKSVIETVRTAVRDKGTLSNGLLILPHDERDCKSIVRMIKAELFKVLDKGTFAVCMRHLVVLDPKYFAFKDALLARTGME